jgi:DNA-damage-inducible protein D
MTEKKLTKQVNIVFEQIRRIDGNGNEYWSARDLSKVLEYSEYRHFFPVVERAKDACQNSGHPIPDHFEDILEMVPLGSGAERQVDSVKLSRYVCYLIVQNQILMEMVLCSKWQKRNFQGAILAP